MQGHASRSLRSASSAARASERSPSRLAAAYPRLVLFSAALTFVVICWGSYVRATGAGLSCPDWPMCNGRILPTADKLVLTEWGHRLIAAVLGIVVFLTTAGAWRWHRRDRSVLIPATLASVFVITQIILGAITVTANLSPQIVSAHLGTSMMVFAMLLVTAAGVLHLPRGGRGEAVLRQFPPLALFGALATYGLMLSGSYVIGSGAGAACRSWPLCNGLPGAGDLVRVHMFHRTAVLLVGAVAGYILFRVRGMKTTNRALYRTAHAAFGIYLLQALIGAGNIWIGLTPAVQVAHVGGAAAMWAAMVLLATFAWRAARLDVESDATAETQDQAPRAPAGRPESLAARATLASPSRGAAMLATSMPVSGRALAFAPAVQPAAAGALLGISGSDTAGRVSPRASAWLTTARAYLALTKPRIVELLLVTTVPAMVLAERGLPSLWLIAVTVIGGALTGGGANAINCVIDRDIDQVMQRTQSRPLPMHLVTPARALIFSIGLEIAGFLLLALFANLLTAMLALGATLFYVFVYTLWLKRTNVQNIVIGGAAGAVPPLVGWAAVTGRVGWPAVVMFLIIFFWTPAHFWALATKYKDDYARAGVPMAPVVWSAKRTNIAILIYTLITVAVAFLLVPAGAGLLYALGAALLGGAFILYAVRLLRQATTASAMRLFVFSILYLGLLFGAMVLDQAARGLGGSRLL